MRWFLVILLVLVLVGLWTAVFFFPEILWIGVLVTVLLLAIVVTVIVLRWRRAKAAAAAADPALVVAKKLEAEKNAERRGIRTDLRRDIGTLRRGGRSVARIPWVGLIGPAGGGKTTFIERSGLAFTAADATAPKSDPKRGSRIFEWWWSPGTLVLEAAGSLTAEEGGRDKWLALLDGLRSLRPDRPLDGLVVALGIGDLAGLDEVGLRRLSTNLRRRVDEALERLEVVLPVYLVLTKADAIPGFVDLWSALSPEDLATVWGASFEVGDTRLSEPARAVGEELAVLAGKVHMHVLDRVPAEGDPARRERIVRFPFEFAKASAPIGAFVEWFLRSGASDGSVVFRGFYLTGATSGGSAPSGESKSYFSREILGSVIVPDRNLATRSASGTRRRLGRELRTALVALVVAVVARVPAIVSYARNAELAGEVDASAGAVTGADAATVPGMASDPIESLADLVDRLDQDASGLSVPGWFGPRSARGLLAPTRRLYVGRLNAWFLRRVKPELDRQLDTISAAHGLADTPMAEDDVTPLGEAYETVKLCATLVDPKGHVDPAWTPQRLARVWRSLLADAGVVSNERLVKHATSYLAALEEDPSLAWSAPRSLPTARDRLKKFDIRGLPYRRLLLWAKDEPAIRASDIFGGSSLEFLDCRGDVQVPGAYTANGWGKIREGLRSGHPWPAAAVIDRWVLGDSSVPADEHALRDQVRAQYFDDYTRRWMAFLEELRVKTPPNGAAAKAELGAFKEPDGFYGALFHQFKLNAIHDDEPLTLAATVTGLASKLPWAAKLDLDAGTKSSGPSPVEKSFKPLLVFSGDVAGDRPTDGPAPLEKYRLILTKLKAALDAPSDQPAPDAQTQFSEASNGVAALLDAVDEPTRGRLWRLMMPPVNGGVQAAKVESVGSLSDDWKSSVWTAWDEKLSGHFPFNKSSAGPAANFADFAAFFKPNDGVLWGFVHAKLANWVERSGSGAYLAKRGAEPLAPELLECISVSQEISDMFFHEGEEPGLKVSFLADWTAPDVTTAKMDVGSKETLLPRAQWSAPVKWFGEDAKLEWVQAGRPTQELGRHAFSLFDLFDQLGGLKPAGARGVYALEFSPLSLKVRAEGRSDALKPDFFARLRCPREIDMAKR